MGIVIARQFPLQNLTITLHLAMLCICSIGIFWLIASLIRFESFSKTATLFGLLSIVLFGYYRTTTYSEITHPDHFIHHADAKYFLGTIEDLPKEGKSIKVILNISHCGPSIDSMTATTGTLMTYLEVDSTASQLVSGDVLAVNARIRKVSPNANPRVFDFKLFLENRNIYYQAFVKSGEWQKVADQGLPIYLQWAAQARVYCLNVIKTYIPTRDEQAVASAMILGIRSLISDELYDAYTDTGAVHVLAVSGLHVGIVSGFLLFLFNRIKSKHWTVLLLRGLVCVASIWTYVLLTGAAPAVVRAAIMFTFLFVGKSLSRDADMYNILSISALLMLIYEPTMLYQASFQFSFLALWSIVFFYPFFSSLASSKYWVINKMLASIAVAVAAQILVFPLTIAFFHKFANHFWLSGLFVVAAAFAILGLGLVLLFVHKVAVFLPFLEPVNSMVIAPILNFLLKGTNWLISGVQALPYSSSDGLWLGDWAVWLIYAGIAMFMLFITQKKTKYLLFGSSIACVVVFGLFVRKHVMTEQRLIYIYDVYGGSLIDVVNGNALYTLKSKGITEQSEFFIANNNRAYHNSKYHTYVNASPSTGLIEVKENFLRVADQVFLLAGHDSTYQNKTLLPVDYAIIQNDYVPDIQKLRNYYDVRGLIVDGTNSYKVKKLVRDQCYKYKLSYHDTQYGAVELAY